MSWLSRMFTIPRSKRRSILPVLNVIWAKLVDEKHEAFERALTLPERDREAAAAAFGVDVSIVEALNGMVVERGMDELKGIKW